MDKGIEVVLFNYSTDFSEELIQALNFFVTEELPNFVGKFAPTKVEDELTKKKTFFEKIEFPLSGQNLSYEYERGKDLLSIALDQTRNKLFFYLLFKVDGTFTTDKAIKFAKKITTSLPFTTFSISDLEAGGKSWGELVKRDASYYNQLNFFFAANDSWIQVYSAKKERDTRYLPLPDEFYLNIPAYKVEQLEDGSILVVLYEDPYAPIEKMVQRNTEVFEYYKKELEKIGLWGKIQWSPVWRETYKELLHEKGFEI